ncbi:hypothetical protein FAF44_03295 [Nonomuraea sp. MG754425]|uniref:hypothetical protein n=1 Tax=Nonomuraea sp. MG754425 TaxID=2570319 RepID=UPI001F31267F|nr:hypothetical protein [Nonomuraea sp. MG754425]MCF6467440.1 hypothetical protein [Nonomuraea sp. MG754425]
MTYVHTDGRPAGARITPESHPCRWLAEEVALFRQGRCSWQVEFGNGNGIVYCLLPSDSEADFGHCTEHALAVEEDSGGANWWEGLGEEHEDPTLRWDGRSVADRSSGRMIQSSD